MKTNAKITIDCVRPSEHTVNPYLFGHFVEDIRDHMEAMLAFPLKDMDFESETESKTAVSGSWRAYTNGRNTRYAMEAPAPKHSGRAQRIRILSDDEAYAGITQITSLQGPKDYTVRMVARASIELRYLMIEAVDRRTEETLGQLRVELSSHNWQEYQGQLSITRACADAEIRVYIPAGHPRWVDHVSTGMLWIDHVSMLPVDSIAMVKREVVDMTRELNAGMMRLAGNYISAYHWEHGIGPVLERPVMYNEAWGGWTSKYFGTDEFIRFCRELRVEPLICVNDGSGTPEEAAQWIEYCNGSVDTPMGALRAKNGSPEPYDVRYWEIGNEVWGQWQVGTCTADRFAERTISFAKAMKEADDSIVLLACGHYDQDWNQTVLDLAGEYMDYLTLHLYHGYGPFGMNRDTPAEDRYKAIASYPEWTRHYIRQTTELIRSQSKHSHVKLAITEYNTMYYPNTVRKGLPNEHTLGAAVANAANLNEMIRCSDMVHIGSFSDLVNGWLGGCIRVGDYYADQYCGKEPGWSGLPLEIYGTPTYEVLKLYANRDIRRILPVKAECGTFSVSSHKKTPVELDALPDLDIVAGTNDDGSVITLLIVNRSLGEARAELELQAFEASGETTVYEITGNFYDDINSVFQPEQIKCKEYGVSAEELQRGYPLRPSSIYALEFRAKPESGGVE
ncbi:alpha-L-arabinofuranosidase [Paenibacillus glucanolyticus]|uniref:alpha-L-arabinofuranosidase C-terminal domain-containing protein n=1 Tax=Paenibacillus TaxID=44249 RepID=UPI0003E27337|nr:MULTISPECIES: alpha-L-arabinofuranosidase C-terminal domain-containing protein [Paenibacillus]ANA80826.1 alpha-L-arabinofuranosidase [Paenibacillus glucanolyticus]AVV55102.1 alpha-L-arabinofuranosidase [Paenibacillus glucanolyticus]ETT40534.1 alpha-L-arabinofuranosidase domain-containing protein [Paenibacillus sp. FSL R5-808]